MPRKPIRTEHQSDLERMAPSDTLSGLLAGITLGLRKDRITSKRALRQAKPRITRR